MVGIHGGYSGAANIPACAQMRVNIEKECEESLDDFLKAVNTWQQPYAPTNNFAIQLIG